MGQFENKHEIFLKRFAAKEHSVVAIVDGKIVAYEWFSDKPFHIEERHLYKITIPLNAFYAYDAYILPEYRMSGIWLKLKLYSFDLMEKLGRDTVLSFINQENRLSMNTHLRFGFVPFRKVYGARFFRKAIFREIDIQETGNAISTPSPLNPRRSAGSSTTS
jgi:L-amino acid N-acyltransferase YncA